MSVLCLSNSLHGFMGVWVEKWQDSNSIWHREVLRELAMDSNSDMEPGDESFLLDGDDFIAKSSNGDMSDEPVPSVYILS